MSSADLQKWKRAASTIGRPRALERAANKLPDRLAWLLRGLGALDQGHRSAVREVARQAEAAGQGEVAAVLNVMLAAPDSLDPTAVRKEAKRAGLGAGMPLPFLDLLRLLAAWRSGKRTIKNTALRRYEQHRPMLQALNHALSTSSSANYNWPNLHKLSLHADQVVAAVRQLDTYGHLDVRFIERNYSGDLLRLTPARWPDLTPGMSLVGAWRKGEGDWPGHFPLPTDPAVQRRLLSGILIRMHQQIMDGRLAGLSSPAECVLVLAQDLGLHKLRPLLNDLFLRLLWLDTQHVPPELLDRLLTRARTTAEVTALGALAVELEELTPRQLRAAIFWAAARPDADDAAEVLQEILDSVEPAQLPRHTLTKHLCDAGVDAWRRGWLEMVFDQYTEHSLQALQGLTRLVEHAPDLQALAERFSELVIELDLDSRSHRQACDAFLIALAGKSADPSVWGPLLSAEMPMHRWPAEVLRVIAQIAARDPSGLSAAEQMVLLEASVIAGQEERTEALLKQIGRQLVRMRPQRDAVRHGLLLLGAICTAEPRIAGAGVSALSRFVARQSPQARAEALASMDDSAPVVGLLRWWNQTPEAGEIPDALKALVKGDVFDELLSRFSEHPALMRAVDEMVDTFCEDPDQHPAQLFEQLIEVTMISSALDGLGGVDPLGFSHFDDDVDY